ncbi:MAG: 16S rRNA (guanine(966)-N(2))-methyltransferase RsmD [Rhodospirillales bacterium]
MKIVAGRFRGRTLEAPKGRDVRPTSSRVREAVFNILENGKPALDLAGIVVLDLFAGTGALGFEALSRGAVRAIFLDRAAEPLALIRRNAGRLGIPDECVTLKLDSSKLGPPPRVAPAADLAFLDPPYGLGLVEPALLGLARNGWLNDGAVVVCETPARTDVGRVSGYEVLDVRDYGAARVTFLSFAA